MLSELFEFKTEEEYKEIAWESEATEELLEDIVKKKFEKYKKQYPSMVEELEEKENKILKVAKEFIKMCKKIGGKPKVREYASRHFGTIDMVCYLEDVDKLTSMWYDTGVISITTDEGTGAMHLPRDFKADIRVKGNIRAEEVEFGNYLMEYFGVKRYVEGIMKPKKIDLDIYDDHIRMVLKGKEE